MSALLLPPATPARTRVLLADAPGFSRDALTDLLAGTAGVELVGVAGDPRSLRAAIARLAPHVLVIDDRQLQDLDWLPGGPGLHVIVVGVDDDPGYAVRATRLGAVTWLPKERADLLLETVAAIGDVVGNYGRAPRLTADDGRGSRV